MYDPTKNTGYPGPPAYPAQPGYPPTGFAPYGGQPQYSAGPYGGYPQQGFPGGPPPVIGFQGLGPQDASHGSPFVAGPQQPPQQNSSARVDPEANVAGFGGSFGDKAVRQAFVRKVYSILSVQLLFTLGFIALCVFVIDVKLWLRRNIWTYYLSYATFLGTYIALVCCPSVRKNHPTNMIVLAIFTAAMAFMTGMISSFHNTQIVLMAIGITAAVTVTVTLFAMNTKYDVTGCGMFLFIVSLVLMVFGIATMIVFFVDKDAHRIMSLVYGALMALVFSMYLMYDVQQIMGGRKIELSPEEHVFGAIQLYLDIVYIFLAILQISSFFSST